MLLAFDDAGELLTCCHLERRDEAAYFGMFAVRPSLQAGGIGASMLAEAERVARDEWRVARMEMQVIDVRDELIAWYERRGYARTGRTSPFPDNEVPHGRSRRPGLRFAVLAKNL
jgi:GNAT superfamily N-acetyltransferase